MRFLRYFCLFLSLVLPTFAHAQHAPPVPFLDGYTTPGMHPDEALRSMPWVPNFTPHNHTLAHPPQEEKRYSYYGYRHLELHKRGLVDTLQALIEGKSCCNNIHGGECRITAVDLPQRTALIDGQWCPLDKNTAIRTLPGLEEVSEEGEAYPVSVVCASRNSGRCGGTTYCVGVKPGG